MKTWILDLPDGSLRECHIHEPIRVIDSEYLDSDAGPIHTAFIINPDNHDQLDQMLLELRSKRAIVSEHEQKIIRAMSHLRLHKPIKS